MAGPVLFLSPQIEQNPAFFEEILGKFWKRAKSGFRAIRQLLPDLYDAQVGR